MIALLAFINSLHRLGPVRDWAVLQGWLRQTFAFVAPQKSTDRECGVVANFGASLPVTSPNCRIVRVDLPLSSMPDQQTQPKSYYAGLKGVADTAHVMIVGIDNLMYCGLAAFVNANRDAPRWNIGKGRVWSGGRWCLA